MGPQVIWILSSYGIIFSVALAFFMEGQVKIAIALGVLVPAIRVARRFRKNGGYHLMGGAGVVSGTLSQRGGFASRESAPFYFWICFLFELAAIAGFAVRCLTR